MLIHCEYGQICSKCFLHRCDVLDGVVLVSLTHALEDKQLGDGIGQSVNGVIGEVKLDTTACNNREKAVEISEQQALGNEHISEVFALDAFRKRHLVEGFELVDEAFRRFAFDLEIHDILRFVSGKQPALR